jgi:hypothetical protein
LLIGAALACAAVAAIFLAGSWIERVTRDRFWPVLLPVMLVVLPVGLWRADWAVAVGFVGLWLAVLSWLTWLYAHPTTTEQSEVSFPITEQIMSLEERRNRKRFEDEVFAPHRTALQQLIGTPVDYDLIWESLDGHPRVLGMLESYQLPEILATFRSLCADALGKEAVAGKIKSLRLRNVPGCSHPDQALAVNGEMWELSCDWSECYFQVVVLERLLERRL